MRRHASAFLPGLVKPSSALSDRMFSGLSGKECFFHPSQLVCIGLGSLDVETEVQDIGLPGVKAGWISDVALYA